MTTMLETVLCAAFAAAAPLPVVQDGPPPARDAQGFPVAIAVDAAGGRLYVAEDGAPRISIVDLGTETVVGVLPLPAAPTGLALSGDGDALYVTAGVAPGSLVVIDTRAPQVTRTVRLGHSPVSPTLDATGRTLWYCDRFADSVGSVDLATDETGPPIRAPREPIACALAGDGATLVIATHLPSGPADGDYAAAEVLLVDTGTRTVRARIELPNGSTSLRDLCVSPDGRLAFVPHILARYHHPATQLERGWVNTNALSIIDLRATRVLSTVLLDGPERGAANPWGVACAADGARLVVTIAGGHAIQIIDVPQLLERLGADAQRLAPDDLTFLDGLRRSLQLDGLGPRAVVVAGDVAYAVEYFSASVGVVDLDAGLRPAGPAAHSVSLGPRPELTEVRRGELLFHDARICFQEWQSCASCHPDGRADGLNWDLMNDGFGNPKQTKSLLLAHRTPPTTSKGARANAAVSVRAGLRHIHFAQRPEAEARAIDAYLDAMQPVPSPLLESGELSAAARRGREVFVRSACARCHTAPLYTDLRLHELGTARGVDEGDPLDTPTLVEVWRTAPYLHDGRSADLRAMLVEDNPADRHGHTSGLSERDLADLIEYVRSL